MVRIAAIISLAIAVIFDAWQVKHGVWDDRLFALLGLLLWCISDRWDR
jgi:hypothetical protein